MFEMLLSNLLLIGILVLMYLGSLALNTLFGTYYSISNLKENFSKEKMISGLTKGGIILVGALGITVLISLLPEVLAAFGIAAETNLIEGISIAAIAGVMGSTILKYLSDALQKFYSILGFNLPKKNEENKEEVE